ncbi:MAG: hypothetical protein ABSA80_09280 [Terriglobales bacterium]|jgi:hypothetical protein
MATLVINAPKAKIRQTNAQSFETTLTSCVGDGYAIWKTLVAQVNTGSGVVLLDKDQKKRAEGTLVRLVPIEKTGNGIQRYEVHMKNLRIVPYKSERLNRNGVAVI